MLESLIKILNELFANPWVLIFGGITLIEWVPIKVHPWKWIANLVFGDIRKDVQSLKNEVTEMKVQNWRWNVLDFANSCKNGRRHTLDEWKHCISQLAEYENYIARNDITNGVFEEDAKYLREGYQEHCKKNDFL